MRKITIVFSALLLTGLILAGCSSPLGGGGNSGGDDQSDSPGQFVVNDIPSNLLDSVEAFAFSVFVPGTDISTIQAALSHNSLVLTYVVGGNYPNTFNFADTSSAGKQWLETGDYLVVLEILSTGDFYSYGATVHFTNGTATVSYNEFIKHPILDEYATVPVT